ncbi:MAG: ureidoglycolate lyase [Alphaproteobacteria bacterium]|jgi:ureidoglycolate hydrolase
MSNTNDALNLIPLTAEGFAPFGRAVPMPSGSPTSKGAGFDCWFNVAELTGQNLKLGQVVARRGDGSVRVMERHPDIELLVPITGPMIQVVAPGRDLTDATEQPRAEEAIAFVLQPGEAAVVAPGVWHSAAMPVDEETLYMFAGLPHAPEPGREASPWISFQGNRILAV